MLFYLQKISMSSRLGKIVGKTIYHFFGKKVTRRFAYIKNFFCNFALDFESEKKRDTTEIKSVQFPKNWNTNLLNISRIQILIFGVLVRWFEPHIPPKIVTRKNKRGANFRSSFHLQSFLWSIVGEGAFSYDASKKGFIANPPCIGGYKEKGSDPNCNEPQKLNKKLLGFITERLLSD